MLVYNMCNAQSLEEDKIYVTQFLDNIYLDSPLQTNVHKNDNATIHIIESNGDNQVTRELNRLSDSTFLYTEYEPMHYEEYIEENRKNHISKQGILQYSNETIVDSSEMRNPETYGNYPSPRLRNIYKQTGLWFEKYNDKNNMIQGSYNLNGKHGKWYYYHSRGYLDKILTYENGKYVDVEYINYLNFESIEKSKQTVQGTWSIDENTLVSNFHKNSSTYTFEPDGTVVYTFRRLVDGELTGFTRKGTWSVPDYMTLVFSISNRKRTLKLEHLTGKLIRFKEEKKDIKQ